ncbi:MAG: hypothetical protein AAB316_14600, partial [Bacteroidota bacterium]
MQKQAGHGETWKAGGGDFWQKKEGQNKSAAGSLDLQKQLSIMRKISRLPQSKPTVRENDKNDLTYQAYLWYKEHEQELLQRYYGRYIVIKDEQVIADYADKVEGWYETIKTHKQGTFIVHYCGPAKVRIMR